jgi:hypothetical protein
MAMEGRAWVTELSHADFFPSFVDERAYIVYCRTRLFNLQPVDLVMSAVPMVLLAALAFATRCSLPYLPVVNPLFAVALSVLLVTFSLSYIFVAALMCKMCLSPLSRLYNAAHWFLYHPWLPRAVYDSTAVLIAFNSGLFLYARVLQGQCASEVDVWASQACNPVADRHSIPHDQVTDGCDGQRDQTSLPTHQSTC